MTTFESSTLLTTGLVFRRAMDRDLPVKALVAGHWFEGHVRGTGPEGVALSNGTELTVLKRESVDAVIIDVAADDRPELERVGA